MCAHYNNRDVLIFRANFGLLHGTHLVALNSSNALLRSQIRFLLVKQEDRGSASNETLLSAMSE